MTPVAILRKPLAFFMRLKLYAALMVWYIAIIGNDILVVSGDMSSFQQNDYTVEFHHVHLEFFDRKFVRTFDLKNVKPNRTHKAFAMTFNLLTDIKDDGRYKINLKGFRLLGNGLDHLICQFNIDVCQALRKNTFGLMQMIRAGNMTTCPITKGYYYANNFVVDEKKMPPYMPEGRYKVMIAILDGNTPMTRTSLFMDIIYKIKN
ncbi:Protein of unknown function (DUF1091) [Popillia japonica]|uniref:MD-2-related lipid-recognition domain-containing protein n=1 Tax=Popillia japonica TaxID=7064 RepID=A0AAW1ITU0_POPJA